MFIKRVGILLLANYRLNFPININIACSYSQSASLSPIEIVMSLYLLDAICGLATLYFANELLADKLWRKTTNNYGAPLPPGPQPLPLIGNLLDMPKGNEGQHWAKLNDRYGELWNSFVVCTCT